MEAISIRRDDIRGGHSIYLLFIYHMKCMRGILSGMNVYINVTYIIKVLYL